MMMWFLRVKVDEDVESGMNDEESYRILERIVCNGQLFFF